MKTTINHPDLGEVYVNDNTLFIENKVVVDVWVNVSADEVILVRHYRDKLPEGITHQEVAEMSFDTIMDTLTEPPIKDIE